MELLLVLIAIVIGNLLFAWENWIFIILKGIFDNLLAFEVLVGDIVRKV